MRLISIFSYFRLLKTQSQELKRNVTALHTFIAAASFPHFE